ncbi:MAG TPA: 50S ribosomal protein L20 [bacterium]|jgi:large subunit ribosomal protein L20|nr:50S ribosomal protein L20 [bacterium]
MPRAKGGSKTRQRRNRILKQAKGFRGAKSRLIRQATEAVNRGMRYATRHRKLRKRDFRKLWIARLGVAAKENGMSYAELIGRLNKAKVGLNRKMLSELAIHNPKAFAKVVEAVR